MGLRLYSWCLSSRILQEEPNHTKPVSRMGFCGNLYQISIAQLKLRDWNRRPMELESEILIREQTVHFDAHPYFHTKKNAILEFCPSH
jgi:hypothetical protein